MGKLFPALQKLLGTKQRMFSAYHPQTDGQTERASHVLQKVLRHVIGIVQNYGMTSWRPLKLAINMPHAAAWAKASRPSCLVMAVK